MIVNVHGQMNTTKKKFKGILITIIDEGKPFLKKSYKKM